MKIRVRELPNLPHESFMLRPDWVRAALIGLELPVVSGFERLADKPAKTLCYPVDVYKIISSLQQLGKREVADWLTLYFIHTSKLGRGQYVWLEKNVCEEIAEPVSSST